MRGVRDAIDAGPCLTLGLLADEVDDFLDGRVLPKDVGAGGKGDDAGPGREEGSEGGKLKRGAGERGGDARLPPLDDEIVPAGETKPGSNVGWGVEGEETYKRESE